MEPLKHYVVTWEIDVFANDPQQAAEIALDIQRDPESEAIFFTVALHTDRHEIDLLEQDV